MDTLECIATRRSIRKFKQIPIEFEKVGNILEAGKNSPSAGNLQDWKFILVTEKETRENIAKACLEQYWIAAAPVIIVVCTEPSKTKRFYEAQGDKFSIQDGAAAVMSMLLAAHAQGLASCWVGGFEDVMIKRVLKIPDDIIVAAVLPFGYPDEKVPQPVRFTLENVTFIEAWNNRIKDLASYMEWYGEHIQKIVKKGRELVKQFARRIQQ